MDFHFFTLFLNVDNFFYSRIPFLQGGIQYTVNKIGHLSTRNNLGSKIYFVGTLLIAEGSNTLNNNDCC